MKRLVLLSLIICLLSACSDRFSDYQSYRDAHTNNTSSGALHSSQEIRDYELLVTPVDSVDERILSYINNASDTIDVNVYMLTHKKIIQSLVDANNRWVRVRVVLERSVYQNPRVNDSARNILQKAGVKVEWADETRINFNHAKYLIIDSLLVLGTGNLTPTTFSKNREFFVITQDSWLIQYMRTMFDADFHRFPFSETYPSAIVSPINSRTSSMGRLRSAQSKIRVFAPSLSDRDMIRILKEKSKDGIEVEVCLAYENTEKRHKLREELVASGIIFRQAKKPYVHGKTLLFDEQTLLVWSINFTDNSFDNNREVSLILANSKYTEVYKNQFKADCRD